jgi:hypothetical protein
MTTAIVAAPVYETLQRAIESRTRALMGERTHRWGNAAPAERRSHRCNATFYRSPQPWGIGAIRLVQVGSIAGRPVGLS